MESRAREPRHLAGRTSASAVPGEPVVNPHRPVDATVRKLRGERNPLRRALAVLGPGLVTGASDDDPSGIGTYAQAGAQFGYATLWATIAMLPMMISIQYISARIGLVTGRGLGGVFIVPVSVGILALQPFGSCELIAKVFKWLALALLAYIGAALFAHPRVLDVLRGTLIPTIRLDPQYIGILVALLGTTISPYPFFWQASQEVDEQIVMGRRRLRQRQGASKRELGFALWDTVAGMVFSEIVAYFIILAAGATLFVHGETHIISATEAAQALRPIAGDAAALLLAAGLIGAGVLAVPVLTASAAYGVAGALDWKQGLTRAVGRAPLFYLVIGAATLVGMAINFLGLNPITALVLSAVLNGLLAPPLLVLVMLVSNDRAVMGERTNGRLLNVMGWATTVAMSVAALALIVTTVVG